APDRRVGAGTPVDEPGGHLDARGARPDRHHRRRCRRVRDGNRGRGVGRGAGDDARAGGPAAHERRILRERARARGARRRRRGGESGAGSGAVTLTLDGEEELVVDEVLVATGRRPRTGDLGLETVGLDPGDPLTTDDTLAVTFEEEEGAGGARPWLFAAGD